MISPEIPAGETDRLDSLRALGVLDTLPELHDQVLGAD